VWFRCCLVDSVDEHELKEQNKKSVLGVHPDSCKIKTNRQSIYHLQAVFELLYLQRSLHYVFKWEKRSTYPSPSWNPATTYVFHSGLMLDLRMYITLVNQENRLAGVYTKPSFKHSSSILKKTTKPSLNIPIQYWNIQQKQRLNIPLQYWNIQQKQRLNIPLQYWNTPN